MRIVCTVEEFGQLVRGCHNLHNTYGCSNCPLYDVCEDGFIEQFISAEDVVPGDEAEVLNGDS